MVIRPWGEPIRDIGSPKPITELVIWVAAGPKPVCDAAVTRKSCRHQGAISDQKTVCSSGRYATNLNPLVPLSQRIRTEAHPRSPATGEMVSKPVLPTGRSLRGVIRRECCPATKRFHNVRN